MAVTALILAIPGALTVTLDLVERASLAKRKTRLKKKAQKSTGDVVLIRDQREVDVKTANEAELINILIEK